MGLILKEELENKNSIKNRLIKTYIERTNGKKQYKIDKTDKKRYKTVIKKANSIQCPKFQASYRIQFNALLSRSFLQARGVYISKMPFIQIISIAIIMGLFWFQVCLKMLTIFLDQTY